MSAALVIDRAICNGCGACSLVLYDQLGGPDDGGRAELPDGFLREHRGSIDRALNSCKTGALALVEEAA